MKVTLCNKRGMKILVTGAKGFVGKNLCAQLNNIKDGKARCYGELKISDVYLLGYLQYIFSKERSICKHSIQGKTYSILTMPKFKIGRAHV